MMFFFPSPDPAVAAAGRVSSTLEAAPRPAQAQALVILVLELELPSLPRLLDALVDGQLGLKIVLQLGLAGECEGVVVALALTVHPDVPASNAVKNQ